MFQEDLENYVFVNLLSNTNLSISYNKAVQVLVYGEIAVKNDLL